MLHKLQGFMSETGHVPEFSRQNQFHEGAMEVSGKRERSGLFCNKSQTCLLVFLWSRIGTDLEMPRVKAYFSLF